MSATRDARRGGRRKALSSSRVKRQGKDTLLERLWSKIDVKDSIEECWPWMGGGNVNGYGTIHIEMRNGKPFRRSVPSVLYETAVGPLGVDEKGNLMEPDHLCRNTKCSNPFHLEEVTHEENVHRASPTVCPYGHDYDEENTYIDRRGARHCRRCNAARGRIRALGIRQKLKPYDNGRLDDVEWLDDGGCIMTVYIRGTGRVKVQLTRQEADAILA